MKEKKPKPICEIVSRKVIDNHTILTEYKSGRMTYNVKSVFLAPDDVVDDEITPEAQIKENN
ncbi:MAG: hypothetical protein RRZ42_07335 [Oscillospiraceae bacterium]